MQYDHVQRGYTPLLYVPVSLLLLWVLGTDDEVQTWLFALTTAFIIGVWFVLIAFNRLRATVDAEDVTVAFSSGKPKRVFPLADISGVRTVRNRWWMGWGIRKVPTGWMYNVWGLDAVEIDLPDGESFRIGTDDAGNLHAAIALGMRGDPSKR